MMLNALGLVAMLAAAASLIWSGSRAWRVSNRVLKWGGVGLAAVLAVAVSLIGAITLVGTVKQHARRPPVPDLKVEATPQTNCPRQGRRRRLLQRVPFGNRYAHRWPRRRQTLPVAG